VGIALACCVVVAESVFAGFDVLVGVRKDVVSSPSFAALVKPAQRKSSRSPSASDRVAHAQKNSALDAKYAIVFRLDMTNIRLSLERNRSGDVVDSGGPFAPIGRIDAFLINRRLT
jgi:hypothetical protein